VYETIRTDVADGVASLVMNRPGRHNAMTIEMVGEAYRALEDISRREDIRVVTLTGAGDDFCPGGDVDAFVAGAGADSAAIGLGLEIYAVPALLHDMPQLTIAAINGSCAGAALGWACGCDLKFAVEGAKFSTAFLPVGLAGDMCLPWSLPRIIGAGRARELSFLADVFDAHEALRSGWSTASFRKRNSPSAPWRSCNDWLPRAQPPFAS